MSSGEERHKDRGNSRNNTRKYSSSTKFFYKGEIESLGYVLALKYEKVELDKSFDVFRGKIINYTIKYLNNAQDIIALIQDMEDPKAFLNAKTEPNYLDETEAKYEINKAILTARVRHYFKREAIVVSNMKNMYGIIWGQCYPGLQ